MDVTTLQACRDELNSILMTKVAIRQVASDIDWKAAVKKRGMPKTAPPGMSRGARSYASQAGEKAWQAQKAKKWGAGKATKALASKPSAGRRVAQTAKKGLNLLKRVL